MAITRLQGTLTLPGGPVVSYCCGWLLWPTDRSSHRGRPLHTLHSAHDPADAARHGGLPCPSRSLPRRSLFAPLPQVPGGGARSASRLDQSRRRGREGNRRRNTPRTRTPPPGTTCEGSTPLDGTCSECHGPAPDGPVHAGIGLLCWDCADVHFLDSLLPWGDPARSDAVTSL